MGQAAFHTKRWLRRNGTSRIPYNNIASPEWDKPHSLRKDGFAGMGQAAFPTKNWLRRNGTSRIPYEKLASPEWDKPHSLRIGGVGHTANYRNWTNGGSAQQTLVVLAQNLYPKRAKVVSRYNHIRSEGEM